MLSQTTRMPNGVTNAAPWQTLANAGIPDPTWCHVYAQDFFTYNAGHFAVTVVGTGAVSQIAYDGGAVQLTTSGAINDAVYMQLNQPCMKLGISEAFFKFEGVLANATDEDFYAGLLDTDTSPLVPGNGVCLVKASGGNTFALQVDVGGVVTSYALPSVMAVTAGVAFELGLHIDSQGVVEVFFNPGSGLGPRPVNGSGALFRVAPTLPTALVGPSWGIRNSTAAAHTLTVDSVVSITG